ncbi:MAG TPA: DNA polymerase I, partial [Verrucomicrobia bacterium]|nr:DNA polymerase I [Verrucomicrobiota bacterium]
KEKVGHHLKYDLSILLWHGIKVRGPLFDTMLAHFLIDQDSRHSMDFLAERYMEYSPLSIKELIGEKGDEQKTMDQVDVQVVAEYAAEDADVTWQLRGLFAPLLKEKNQEKVFHEVECPLIEVLVGMEYEGISLDTEALLQISESLVLDIQTSEKTIYEMAGREFNLNSPKQMGEVLFGEMKLVEKPKKTKTGQFMTNEQVLTSLEKKHPICAEILNYRQASKLKSTYVDALPETLNSRTGRIHTTFHQAVAATGRLASSDPNIQNIPIRTERGREIRKAFIPRVSGGLLLSADYSQIELRIIASISGDPGMKQAFEQGVDIHLVTASKVYGIPLDEVSREQRSKSKMVNFGIVYGISAFGLAQRLNISRTESADLIKAYNSEYPGIHKYMEKTIAFAQEHGYVETLTGRRRYLRDINSRNATVRGAAERNAINSPIQGTAADMIKLAMARIHRDLEKGEFQTRMILQVHDELVFELEPIEKEEITKIVEEGMKNALPMDVPIEVDIGVGANWLEAH